MKPWPWVAIGAALFVLGLLLWFTAWIAWPAAVVVIGIAIFAWVKDRRMPHEGWQVSV